MLSYLSPKDVLLLSRACHNTKQAVSCYIQVAYDINATLARFFTESNTSSFRTLQARMGTLISGSCALQFFDRVVYPDSDLDIYVYPQHRREVGNWILGTRFAFAPSRSQDLAFAHAVAHTENKGLHYAMPGVSSIFTFLRQTTGKPLKVQIIVARRSPMEVILGFHSTCVMNVIAYNKAYCLFPRATLEERRSLLTWSSQGRAKRRIEGLVKYSARGFRMLEFLEDNEVITSQPERSFPLKPRWMGDSDTWDEGAIMEFSLVDSPVLKYAIVVGNDDTVDYLDRVLEVKACEEQYKVSLCGLEDWS
ncbi:hypothetical protein C8Q79DRAFT_997722 [Trametes meyenii]|nr:hypothetical protein C8Q79DRAFT_997722 [Trametes meyenii]